MSAPSHGAWRELLAHALARAVHAVAVELRVGTRDVHELEEAELRLRLREADRAHAGGVDRDHLARLDVAHVVRATMSSAHVSLASTQPPSVLPSTSGRKP